MRFGTFDENLGRLVARTMRSASHFFFPKFLTIIFAFTLTACGFVVEQITDLGSGGGIGPITFGLVIKDPVTGSTTYTNQTTVSVEIPANADVLKFCLSETQSLEPASVDAACTGGQGGANGWHESAPAAFDLSLGDGPKTIYLWVAKKDGKVHNENFTAQITQDKTIPSSNITVNPADPTNQNAATFQFSASDATAGIDKLQCKLDSAAYTPCASPFSLTSIADGNHTLYVQAVDKAANLSAAATFAWTVDTASPSVTFSSTPANPTNQTGANFQFIANPGTGTPIANVQCRLDGGPYANCSSPEVLAGLSSGSHTFYVTAFDTAGNQSTVQSFTWIVDTVLPVVSITSAPPNPSNSGNANFVFTSNDIGTGLASVECRLGAAAFAACSSPKNYAGLADGSYNFELRATDNAGNVSTTVSYAWTVDASSPSLTFAAAPPSPTNAGAQTVSGTCSDSGSGLAPTPLSYCVKTPGFCNYPADYTSSTACTAGNYSIPLSLAEGVYDIRVAALDNAGNYVIDGTAGYTVDTTAPVAAVSGEPTGTNSLATANATVSGSGVAYYQYKIGIGANCSAGGGYSTDIAVATPISEALGADGTYVLCVIGKDLAGNYQSLATATTRTWTKDTSAPTAVISGHPLVSPSNVTNFVLDVSGAAVTAYKYKIGISEDCSNTAGYSAEIPEGTDTPLTLSSEGTYVLCAIAKNAAGTWQLEASASSVTWDRDVTPPGAFTAGGATGGTDSTADQ